MKKTIGLLVLAALFVGVVATQAVPVTAKRLAVAEQVANGGANYVVIVTEADFTATAVDTPETLTFPITAGQGFYLHHARVITEFVGTNGTDSVTVTVGDTDVDQYLTSMEMATESTEVVGKMGTAKVDGLFYEAADTIDFTFTTNAENSLTGLTAGEVHFYVKLIE
jgi:hypothetical protein